MFHRYLIQICILNIAARILAFNLSPHLELQMPDPDFGSERSSYFGYTINLRQSSIFIGAPRAKTFQPNSSMYTVQEPGALYQCLNTPKRTAPAAPRCTALEPIEPDRPVSPHFTPGQLHSNQWLGASLDGGPADNDTLVVCAPFARTPVAMELAGSSRGMCFASDSAASPEPRFRALRKPVSDATRLNSFGLSLHVTDDDGGGGRMLIGAPGDRRTEGAVVRMNDMRQAGESLRNQLDYGFFGYAVTSGKAFLGPGNPKRLWVASRPHHRLPDSGTVSKVYVFDIVQRGDRREMDVRHAVRIEPCQLGEYFGYALAADDFDGNGWTDLAVASPFWAADSGTFDNGAVYVFGNARGSLAQWRRLVATGRAAGARFGLALALLGDVNGDGYNDLAVGAPFEEAGGAVYIYHGSHAGLRERAAQRLIAPAAWGQRPNAEPAAAMFGLGLSRGVLVNGNRYPDLAVGAPNAERVIVFRALPVVTIRAEILSDSAELSVDATRMVIQACWSIEKQKSDAGGRGTIDPTIDFEIRLDWDYRRLRYGGSSTIQFFESASDKQKCRSFTVEVEYKASAVFQAIVLDMSYKLSSAGGEPSVATNPGASSNVLRTMMFTTECHTKPCEADLKLSSRLENDLPSPFVLGTNTALSIVYTIRNTGIDPAYWTQLEVTVPPNVDFINLPAECRLQTDQTASGDANSGRLLCTVQQQMRSGTESSLRLRLGVQQLLIGDGVLRIRALASSLNSERTPRDNRDVVQVQLAEFSRIAVLGGSELVSVEEKDEEKEEGDIVGADATVSALGWLNVSHMMEVRNEGPSVMRDALVMVLVPRWWAYVDDKTQTQQRMEIVDWDMMGISITYNNDILLPDWNELQTNRQMLNMPPVTHQSDVVRHLPADQTLMLDCNHTRIHCMRADFRISDLHADPDTEPVRIGLNMSVNLDALKRSLAVTQPYVVWQTWLVVSRDGDQLGETVCLEPMFPATVVQFAGHSAVPPWVYAVTIVGGLLIWIGLTLGLLRCGFFRRPQREELVREKRKSQMQFQMLMDVEFEKMETIEE